MSPRMIQMRLGLGACLVSLVLVLLGIPRWVSSPSNVSNIVLAPTFWPYILAILTGLAGLGLILASRAAPIAVDDEEHAGSDGNHWTRLAILAVIMVATMYALPRLGMVWTTMVIFAFTAFLFRTRHPVAALVCAVIIPLALYAFFAHVAGVAIPQGNFVRLP
ncbi:tripartite tricarboxylate transporter TctB family protein [Sulfitobacter sp. S190]|uniref:tripartite tricarboxylate transporter TctB family protein n=1 Tax=Sulfitobacter sp. S190 TaxID=2867022 RepID=UPI0021A54675|nr:tripartite tricarboxylate transporter TctB family protein [Sulfitobacter sp. S190]UWR24315.1 tripartite tricarboxylate transporter TctB family protein [Sulfitobacter sp. S190]